MLRRRQSCVLPLALGSTVCRSTQHRAACHIHVQRLHMVSLWVFLKASGNTGFVSLQEPMAPCYSPISALTRIIPADPCKSKQCGVFRQFHIHGHAGLGLITVNDPCEVRDSNSIVFKCESQRSAPSCWSALLIQASVSDASVAFHVYSTLSWQLLSHFCVDFIAPLVSNPPKDR